MHTKYSEIKPSTLFELCKALSHVIDEQSFSMDAGLLMQSNALQDLGTSMQLLQQVHGVMVVA